MQFNDPANFSRLELSNSAAINEPNVAGKGNGLKCVINFQPMKFIGILLMVGAILSGCSAGREIRTGSVDAFNSPTPVEHGIWYYLPETVIRVEIIAEKRVAKAGPFFRFSQHLLNISDVITENSETWSIVGANITTWGQPDKSRIYRVTPNMSASLGAVTLTSSGILGGINTEVEDVTENLPAIAQPGITLANLKFEDIPFTGEQLIKGSTTAMAEEVAREIYRLREMRLNILKGNVDLLPPDKGAYNMVLEEITRQERAFVELFKGKEQTERVSAFFDFVPDTLNPLNTILLRFSAQSGLLEKMDVRGTPVFIEVEVDGKHRVDHVALEDRKATNTRGLVYRKPVPAVVRVIDRTLLLSSKQVMLGQFGQTLRLPADLLDNPGVGVKFDTSTGALKKVFSR